MKKKTNYIINKPKEKKNKKNQEKVENNVTFNSNEPFILWLIKKLQHTLTHTKHLS